MSCLNNKRCQGIDCDNGECRDSDHGQEATKGFYSIGHRLPHVKENIVDDFAGL